MSKQTVKNIELSEIETAAEEQLGKNLVERDFDLIRNVSVSLSATVGRARISVEDLFGLKAGDVVNLEQSVDEPMTLHLDGKPIARGNLVAVEDHFGIQITEVL